MRLLREFFWEMMRWAAAGFPLTTKYERMARKMWCRRCPHRVRGLRLFDRCAKCGCFLFGVYRVGSKACPVGHWRGVADRPITQRH
jgi:hypothetical protein